MRIGGKRIRESLHTTERGLAIEKARDLQNKLAAPSGPEISIDEFSKKYLEWAWSAHPASAQREEQRLLRMDSFFTQHGAQKLAEITPYLIEEFRANLRQSGRSPATINRYCQLLRGMFYRAADWGDFTGQNPLRKVKFFHEEPNRRLLTTDEIRRIIEAAEAIATNPRSRLQRQFPDMIRLAVNTGLRKGELLNLRWADIRSDEIIVKGKGERTRIIPLNEEALRALSRQPRRGSRVWGDIGSDYTGTFRRTVDAIRVATKIDWHFHLLRHYFGSTLLAAGVDIVTIANLLGHSRMTTTLIYSHTSENRKREAISRIPCVQDEKSPKTP
jgi:integrase